MVHRQPIDINGAFQFARICHAMCINIQYTMWPIQCNRRFAIDRVGWLDFWNVFVLQIAQHTTGYEVSRNAHYLCPITFDIVSLIKFAQTE